MLTLCGHRAADLHVPISHLRLTGALLLDCEAGLSGTATLEAERGVGCSLLMPEKSGPSGPVLPAAAAAAFCAADRLTVFADGTASRLADRACRCSNSACAPQWVSCQPGDLPTAC